MRTASAEITIQRPPAAVWAILSDLTAMRAYMPGIESVALTSEHATGEGASRHCVFEDGIELDERVVAWDEGAGYTLETTRFVGVPMRSNRITFALRPAGEGATTVSQSMTYAMKGGPFAPLLERMAGGKMQAALDGALGGLKAHAES